MNDNNKFKLKKNKISKINKLRNDINQPANKRFVSKKHGFVETKRKKLSEGYPEHQLSSTFKTLKKLDLTNKELWRELKNIEKYENGDESIVINKELRDVKNQTKPNIKDYGNNEDDEEYINAVLRYQVKQDLLWNNKQLSNWARFSAKQERKISHLSFNSFGESDFIDENGKPKLLELDEALEKGIVFIYRNDWGYDLYFMKGADVHKDKPVFATTVIGSLSLAK